MEKLRELQRDYDVDYIGLSELNKDWRNFSYDTSIYGATSGWTEHNRVQVGNNTHRQRGGDKMTGGTASLAFGDMVFRISKQGNDIRNLGRWTCITLAGKNGLQTTLINCYCPCQNSGQSGSAYSQQLVYMASNPDKFPDDITCPRDLFGHDLKTLVESLQEEGHQVIVNGDFNAEYDFLEKWMLDIGLVDLIKKKHGTKGPRTCTKSKDSPIDAIFGTPTLAGIYSGFMAFGRMDSDHRLLWIDIPRILLFGYNPPNLLSPHARKLKLSDPRVVEKYCTYLHSSMRDHDLFQRMDDLHRRTVYPLPAHLVLEYEELDNLVGRLMTEAENQCRKIKAGAVPWSPAYLRVRRAVEYWVRRLKTERGQISENTRYLINLQNKLGIKYVEMDEHALVLKVKEAFEKRKRCKKLAEELSLEYRTQLAKAKEAAGEMSLASAIRNMNRVEGQRRLFGHIRHMEGKIRGGSTTQVTVTSNGVAKEYTNRKEVEEKIAQNNEAKYHQTESGGCQLTDPVFINDLGMHGEGPRIQEVLDGTYEIPDISTQETKDFLEACKYVDGVDSVMRNPTVIERYRDLRKSWRCRKERTTSYHHHVGHYKAVMKDDYLSWFFFQRSDIPMISGYSPERYRECIDLMILKRALEFELAKQRTLGILDTEFNHNNKLLGRECSKNSLKLDSLATEQFSRPGRSAIDQCISKRCTIDHHQSRRLCFAMTSCDLAGCYDRIVHNAAALALLRIGVSHKRIASMFSTIQRMTHRIRTAFGDSNITYGGDDFVDWKTAPQGAIQGNASGPAIWAVLSSIIFDILHKRGFGVPFCSALSKELFIIVGFSYVDDCDLFQSGEDPAEVLASMQALINSWGSLMEVTGGALRPDKSWWYLVEYVWKRGKWVATDAGDNLTLQATGPDGQLEDLKYLSVTESAEMLGVWMSPSGNKTKLIQVLKQAAVDWAAKVKLGRPSKAAAWTALTTNISAKLKYPLACCTLTEKECKSIMYPAVRAALGKSGIASNLKAEFRDGPILDGGAGATSLFHYQGTSRTALLIEHCARDTPTGKQIRICIEDLVLEAGLFGPIWEMPFPTIRKWISRHSWIYSVLEYNYENEIKISPEHTQLKPKRDGDKAIMAMAALYSDSGSVLRAISRVCMFHGVVCLSDISTSDGSRINEEFLCDREQFDGRRNDYLWPVKHDGNKSDWLEWRKFMEFVFDGGNLTLAIPLNTWNISTEEEWLTHWDWFVDENMTFLYRQVGEDTWQRHVRLTARRGRNFNLAFLRIEGRPEGVLQRASVTGTVHAWTVINTSTRFRLIDESYRGAPTSLGDISFKPQRLKWFMSHLSSSPRTDRLLYHLLHGTALAVSDGSYFPLHKVGACAWVIATPDGSQWISGGGLVPGTKEDQSAYRSELAGQVGIAAFLESLMLDDRLDLSITTLCDGISALRKVLTSMDQLRSNSKHVDLVSILAHLWKDNQFSCEIEHVYGHQDDGTRNLTVKEILNCRMDKFAKQIARAYIVRPRHLRYDTTTLGVGSIVCRGKVITTRIQKSLYESILHWEMMDPLGDILGVDGDTLDSVVSWASYRRARKMIGSNRRHFITKWISGNMATGRVMKQRQQRIHDTCPLCDEPDEHLVHILTCRHETCVELRTSLLTELRTWLEAEDTQEDIANFLVQGLESWFDDPYGDEIPIDCDDVTMTRILGATTELGWFSLLCGYLRKDLVRAQQLHYTYIDSMKSGSKWASTLIVKLWNILHSLWCHRCSHLHDSQAIHDLNGLGLLREAVIAEYNRGHGTLPMVYRPYFYNPLQILLSKPPNSIKNWFLVVRSGRECYYPTNTEDEFFNNATLRAWVGLTPLE